ncbi:MAG: M20 family metallopeptidase [Candidatus Omnitrophica bacterium]|nr:M20 family metallopeptidase [Candidatus Omnitrophota bacterium]
MVNRKRLIKLTQKLISIDSQNPPGDEAKIARFIVGYLKELKLQPKIYEFKKRRSNVVLVLAGRNKKNSLLITPHLDTVPAGKSWSFSPFAARIFRERIYGLGATDCKGNLACALEVINSLVEDAVILDYNLIFAATCDEESGSKLGLIPLLERGILKPTQAVVLDSDDFNIIVTQKGLVHLKVKLQGLRAHGAYPWRGRNAIDVAINILQEIKKYKFIFPKNKYLRPATVNIGTIKGGDKVNVVADWCEFELDFRFLPGMSEKKILQDLKKIIQRYTLKFKIEIEAIQAPYTIDTGHPLAKQISWTMKNFGLTPVVKGSEGATTITFFQNKNIPAIATGFGSANCAHMADEYVKIDNLYKGALVLEEFLKNYNFMKG